MARARARLEVPGGVERVEALWFDTGRWGDFVDGFDRLVFVDPEWPREGSVEWTSRAGGRGTVRERVVRYEPGVGQELEVSDPTIEGTQTVMFAPGRRGRTAVELELRYRIRDASLLTPVLDVLFVRRAFNDSLRRTLARLASELA